ncbi:HAMP domain-containing protein [Calditrichota bacterium]
MAVLVVLAAMIVVNWRFHHFADFQIKTEISSAPAKFDKFQQTRMENLLTLAANVATDARLRGSLATLDVTTISEAARETYRDYQSDIFWVLGPDGKLLTRIGAEEQTELDISKMNLVKNALAGFDDGDVWLFGEHLYQVAAAPIISGKKIEGILLYGFQFENWLTDEFATLTGMHIVLMHQDGLLCSTLKTMKGLETAFTFQSMLNDLAISADLIPSVPNIKPSKEQPPPPQTDFRQDSEPYAGAIFSMNNIAGEKLATGLVFRSTKVEEQLLSRIQLALLIVILGAVIVSFLAAYLLSRNLTNPIERLVASSRMLGMGDLHEPIQYDGKDEIGILATAMEEMRLSLLKAREELIRGETPFNYRSNGFRYFA